MNRAVEVEGESYREVAGRFLAKQGLISEDNIGQSEKSHLEKLVLSIGILDELVGYGGKAFRAVRKVFPKRRVKIFRTSEPLQELIHGKARLAYTGVESFFQISENGLPIQIKFAEAIGAVGYRMCHIIALRDNGLTRLTDMKKIGVGIKNGTSHKTANILLTALGLKDKIQIIYGELTTQVEDLKQKKIDGIVLMTRLGHEKIISLLNQGIFKIIPFQEWQKESNSVRFPFFRISKIPAKTYANQLKDIETIGAQTVLAGISHPQQNIGDVGMPAVPTKAQPLSDNTILRLVEELGVDEKIDPTIPSANILKPKQEIISKTIQADYPSTAANGLIILVLIYLFYLFFQEEKPTK
jgi:hypothetical protein